MQTTDYEAMLQGTNNSQLGFHHGIKTTLPGEKLAGYGNQIRNPVSGLLGVVIATGLIYNAYSTGAGKGDYGMMALAMIGGASILHSIN
jgi:hypothetical protein|tara:strand:- start:573 stop:839 length:267 start_codon:yes stop_codon:yes gene_type:complete